MNICVIQFFWYGISGKLVSSYDESKVKNLPFPVVYKVIEDLDKHTAMLTIGIYKTDIFKPVIIDDERFEDKEYMVSVDLLINSMLQLAHKKGEK